MTHKLIEEAIEQGEKFGILTDEASKEWFRLYSERLVAQSDRPLNTERDY